MAHHFSEIDTEPDYQTFSSNRMPCVLVLDASNSMNTPISGNGGRSRIDELNDGLVTFVKDLQAHETAQYRVQLAVVAVGGPSNDAELIKKWTDAKDFRAPRLVAQGNTPLGKAMGIALEQVKRQKERLREEGIFCDRPYIIVMSDGEPTDDPREWRRVVEECRRAEEGKHCAIFPFVVGDVDMTTLGNLSVFNKVARLDASRFENFFNWLSVSIIEISGERDPLAGSSNPRAYRPPIYE